ncbi:MULTISPECIES: acyl carrier protein [unclassified Streptomyces]|uniref:acyl carrier protein n=1 Tax=unclassified Streptomyces TaxID=2593676 RepID=UPI0022553F81|nr:MULTISPECIES: acyl carrier protein [unclassified Streptomyces]MCX5047753.1 acyl carrier protein [Streptomyces sp. NBC_00474]MCX5057559.1 acyl carrier protein [Streptomyces sp. NBC_00452]MCX5245565.1 acyl carrier protein [Streptomyces sp. NBC_00201]MCX5288634.1 acyl carrier protein [Streptomyces sp. NBC_00183]
MISETGTAPTTDEIRRWLTERIAFYIDLPIERIDPDRKLTELGLDSIYVLTMCGDIEDELGVVVDAAMIWDHPTVGSLAGRLAEDVAESR